MNFTLQIAQAANPNAAPPPHLYAYYDYSRADWGANPLWDSRINVYYPTDRGPLKTVSPDLDSHVFHHVTIQPNQLIGVPDPPQQPTAIIVHDTAGSNDLQCTLENSKKTLRDMQRYHSIQAFGHTEWSAAKPDPRHELDNLGVVDSSYGDIAYHYLVDCAGRIFEGRAGGIYREGQHVFRHNMGEIGIAMLGNFGRKQPTPAQRAGLLRLVTRLCRDLKIDPMAQYKELLLDGTSQTLIKDNKPVLNVAGHVDLPDNDHTDPGVLDLNVFRQDVVAGLANSERQTYPGTDLNIAEPFLSYWRSNGGLNIFGYPISLLKSEVSTDGKSYQVQYFERARLELHPELLGTPYYVSLGNVGLIVAPKVQARYPNPFKAPPTPSEPNIYFSKETHHSVQYGFYDYWAANGGVNIFGQPLSEEFSETDEAGQTFDVQYFERARFEYHPELPEGFKVSLGRLGAAVLAQTQNKK